VDSHHRLADPSGFEVVRLYRCDICGSLDALLPASRHLLRSKRELCLNEALTPTELTRNTNVMGRFL